MEESVRERALLVGLELTGKRYRLENTTPEESLEELGVLAESAGADVLEQILQTRTAPDAATLVGSGKVDELASLAKGLQVDLIIFKTFTVLGVSRRWPMN